MKLSLPPRPITVGVFSPSSPISATVPVRYERGRAYLEERGFSVVDGSLFGKRDAYRSGDIRARAAEFNELLYREDVSVLMASIGGNNTNAILPYVDYAYFRRHPKIVVGYSDATALLLALYAKTGVPVFYGPALAASFGEFPPFVDETFASFETIALSAPPLPYAYEMPKFYTEEFIDWQTQDHSKTGVANEWLCVREGVCRGRLIGGNLNTMEGIFGTAYMPKIRRGDLLLIEDSLKDASTIERSFALLANAGVFDRVGGILLGKHEQFDDSGCHKRPHEILLEVLGDRNVPILAEFDCCHTHPMLTLPIGCTVEMDATNRRLTLLSSPYGA